MLTDERLMELAQPFAADGGCWPSDWLSAMHLAIREAQEVDGLTSDLQRSCIDIEKQLCEALGRQWAPTGISISTLVQELIDKSQNRKVL